MAKLTAKCKSDPAILYLVTEPAGMPHVGSITHDKLARALGNLQFDEPGDHTIHVHDLHNIGRVLVLADYHGPLYAAPRHRGARK